MVAGPIGRDRLPAPAACAVACSRPTPSRWGMVCAHTSPRVSRHGLSTEKRPPGLPGGREPTARAAVAAVAAICTLRHLGSIAACDRRLARHPSRALAPIAAAAAAATAAAACQQLLRRPALTQPPWWTPWRCMPPLWRRCGARLHSCPASTLPSTSARRPPLRPRQTGLCWRAPPRRRRCPAPPAAPCGRRSSGR